MDGQEFIAQMKQGMPGIVRALTNSFLDAAAEGDFAAGGRLFIRLTLFQGFLATTEVIVLLFALSRIINAIKA